MRIGVFLGSEEGDFIRVGVLLESFAVSSCIV